MTKSILLNVRHTNKKFDTCFGVEVPLVSYSCWEGRKKGCLFSPKFKQSFYHTTLSNPDHPGKMIQNIKRWIIDIIDGVAYLHSLGIVHRDLTTRNILEAEPSCHLAISNVFMPLFTAKHMRSMMAIIPSFLLQAMFSLLGLSCGRAAFTICLLIVKSSLITPLPLHSVTYFWLALRGNQRIVLRSCS